MEKVQSTSFTSNGKTHIVSTEAYGRSLSKCTKTFTSNHLPEDCPALSSTVLWIRCYIDKPKSFNVLPISNRLHSMHDKERTNVNIITINKCWLISGDKSVLCLSSKCKRQRNIDLDWISVGGDSRSAATIFSLEVVKLEDEELIDGTVPGDKAFGAMVKPAEILSACLWVCLKRLRPKNKLRIGFVWPSWISATFLVKRECNK